MGKEISRKDLGDLPLRVQPVEFEADFQTFADFAGHSEADLNAEAKTLFQLCDAVLEGMNL